MADNLLSLQNKLKDIMEPDFGLLDHLLSLGVLTYIEFRDINNEKIVTQQTVQLLTLLCEKTDEQRGQFLTALEATSQLHVANYIRQHGGQLRCNLYSI
jgi:hypothetical protein